MKLAVHAASFALVIGVAMSAVAPLVAAPPVPATPVTAAGDPAAGKRSFVQCGICHNVGAGEASTIGPNLHGVVGAKAGARPGYAYSPAMKKSGLVWNAATLDRFLTKPGATVPGTKMAFPGIAAAKGRADIIAYLTTLKPGKP